MLQRPKARLVAVAAAAGTVCALAAAGAAAAAPTPIWASPKNPIPNAFTNASPGLAAFYSASNVRGTFVVWKGQNNNKVMYKYKLGSKWSRNGIIPGAYTTDGPAAAFYTDPLSKNAELVVWKALNADTIYYSTGEVTKAGALNWTVPRSIAVPGDTLATTDEGPAVIFPLNAVHARCIISWRGPAHHVRYELGTPTGRLFTFDKSSWIQKGTPTDQTTTSNAPALAEVLSSNGNGTVYVFWKADGSGTAINYASTPDLKATGLQGNATIPWTLLGGVPGAFSTTGPAASSVNTHGFGPLLLAYKGPGGLSIRYQTFSAGIWSAYGFVTKPNNQTTQGPALVNGTLANISPTSSGRIFLHYYLG
jgi:hypothetical protein